MTTEPLPSIRFVLLDLGGVLVEHTGVERMLEWTEGRFDEASLWEAWLRSTAVRRFETGACGSHTFACGLIEEFSLPVEPGPFLDEFALWASGPHEGAVELVRELGRVLPVATLSNTNEIHHRRLSAQSPLLETFERHFLSYQIGLIKPDAEVFDHVAEEIGLPPEQILFVDDNPTNVEQARSRGLAARLAKGVDATRAALAREGLLSRK